MLNQQKYCISLVSVTFKMNYEMLKKIKKKIQIWFGVNKLGYTKHTVVPTCYVCLFIQGNVGKWIREFECYRNNGRRSAHSFFSSSQSRNSRLFIQVKCQLRQFIQMCVHLSFFKKGKNCLKFAELCRTEYFFHISILVFFHCYTSKCALKYKKNIYI